MKLNELRDNWEKLAVEDAMWAVLSAEEKAGNRWQASEFFETGREEIQRVLQKLKLIECDPIREVALDFGCGVGRLSQALADEFDNVIGVDIASTMIEKASSFNKFPDKCKFVLNPVPDLAFAADSSVDFVYSNIVLQHMRPKFSQIYIREFFRILKIGGIATFQVPDSPSSNKLSLKLRLLAKQYLPQFIIDKLRANRGEARMELYYTPLPKVISLIERSGGRLEKIERDEAAGKNWKSYSYVARRVR